ncbi:MAG: class I SAM-dependent methyltransferase [Gammaproteobacteria bacterium]|nr:MAG: class I SAM-dependent methyltransferase [Gammaproteobacteria bacterium]
MPAATESIGLVCRSADLEEQAALLVGTFSMPRCPVTPESGFYLEINENGLALYQAGRHTPGPVRVDFVGGTMGHRQRFGGGRGQPLARAVGMKPGFSPDICDATAGLGRDGFVLASLGSRVTLCERSPILAALLHDALRRAADDSTIGNWVRDRLQLINADSCRYLQSLVETQRPQVVYMDPMYPAGKGRVQVKKGMHALQQIAGPDMDSGELLDIALQTAVHRVVIKRPKRAGWIHNRKPDTAVESKKTRYDIYVTL